MNVFLYLYIYAYLYINIYIYIYKIYAARVASPHNIGPFVLFVSLCWCRRRHAKVLAEGRGRGKREGGKGERGMGEGWGQVKWGSTERGAGDGKGRPR